MFPEHLDLHYVLTHTDPDVNDLTGKFLISMPILRDPNFNETVVLILEHDRESGAMGLVINRPGPLTVGKFCRELGITWRGDAKSPVHVGGPVSPTVGWLMHTGSEDSEQSVEVIPGIQLSTSQEMLRKVADTDDTKRRLFAGYAGWGPLQMEKEISSGAWITCEEPEHDLIFSEQPERVWTQVMMGMGIDPFFIVPGNIEPA